MPGAGQGVRTMSDYYDYLNKKTAPTPAYLRPMPKVVKPAPPVAPLELSQPMTVEESTASDTIIERVKAFWRT
jgi:hypothetical protein